MRSITENVRPVWRRVLSLAMACGAMAIGSGVHAQQEVNQLLDSLVVGSNTAAQGVFQTPTLTRVAYADVDPSAGSPSFNALTDDQGAAFTSPTASPANYLSDCQTTGTRGLYCLNTKVSTAAGVTTVSVAVLRWQNPDREPLATVALRCSDLNLKNCSGIAVDFAGRLYVAGQVMSGTTYSLFKSTEKKGGACGNNEIASPNYCSVLLDSGRARLYDLSMIEGDAAYSFQYLTGVLVLEDPAPGRAVFFPATGGPGVVLNSSWPVTGQEVLQGATLLQRTTATDTFNYILAATSTGKVLGYLVPWGGKPLKAFDTEMRLNSTAVTADTTVPATDCVGPRYSVRASLRTDRVFFTSGKCVSAFDPKYATTTKQPAVSFPTTQRSFVFSIATAVASVPASTQPVQAYEPGAPAITDPLVGVTVSPGISIDFVRDGCTSPQGCELIPDGGDLNKVAAAKLARVTLADNAIAGWTIWQVTGMRDCRYLWPRPPLCSADTVLDADGNPDPTFNPTQQYLNFTPMLPPEVIDSFTAGPLPPMLVQPDYAARQTIAGTTGLPEYTFGVLFGIAQDGLVYRDWFEGIFDVRDLLGSTDEVSRCGGTTLEPDSLVPPAWDVVLNISELAATVGGPNFVDPPTVPPSFKTPYVPKYVSMLLNVGCDNPTYLAGGRGSAFAYGFVLSPLEDPAGNLYWPDSRYALLMRSLARDFDAHLYTYACKAYPETSPPGPAPFSAATCYQLQKDWPVVYDKLKKCVDATDEPKTSSGAEACNSFETQLSPFSQLVLNAPLNTDVPPGTVPDPFNYVGETKVRWMVLSDVYYSQFKPSLKPGGFVNPN